MLPKESIVYENSQHNLVKGVGGEILTVVGAVQIPMQIQNKTFTTKKKLHVFNNLHHHLLLGKDFLTKY